MKKIFIGIDFSKEKFDATAIFAENQFPQCTETFYQTFTNNRKGFHQLMKWVSEISDGASQEDILFCGENTGTYSKLISDMLYVEGYTMWIENALQINRSMGLKRIKSDKADSRTIAEYAMRFQDRLIPYEPLSKPLQALKELFMQRAFLVKQKKAMAVRTKEKTETDQVLSKTMRLIAARSARLINRLNKEIKVLDDEMKRIIEGDAELKRNYDIITSIKGVALQNASIMLVCTNNFKRFGFNPRKLACYYGVAPFGKESGTSVHVKPHTSPYADTQIKALLSEAALSAIVYCDELKQYYKRLIERGKKSMVAQNNVKNKLIHIICALVRTGQKYDPNRKAQLALQYAKSNN